MTEFIQISTTTAQEMDALKISDRLVEEGLAACAQVLGPIKSTYIWKDDIERTSEFLCLIKTTRDKYPDVEKMIRKLHPYEVPEIIAVPIVEGSKEYLNWINENVK